MASGVMMMPGLSELSRAPLSPQVMLSASTRRMLARFRQRVRAARVGDMVGLQERQAAGSGGSMWPAWLAITMPEPPGAITSPRASMTCAVPIRSTVRIACGDACVGDARRIGSRARPGRAGRRGRRWRLGRATSTWGCLGGEAGGLPLRNAKLSPVDSILCGVELFRSCS
jgi:hypothetical protein